MEPLARTIPPIAVDLSPVSFGLWGRVCDRQLSLPAAARRRRLTSFARMSLEVGAVARSGFVVKNAARRFLPAFLSAALICPAQPALADFTQDGPKLVGTGGVGATVQQGRSVAVSRDGNTAILGGPGDFSNTGAAWVFTLSGGVWSQQGGKLVGTGSVLSERQGLSVALSADGNTAIVGAPSGSGLALVFTRSGGVWTQQGGALAGTGAVGDANQGTSVALSADGNTAIVGGPNDNGDAGAAWVFTRSGGVWTQQGGKLVGIGATPGSPNGIRQGTSV